MLSLRFAFDAVVQVSSYSRMLRGSGRWVGLGSGRIGSGRHHGVVGGYHHEMGSSDRTNKILR